MKRIAKAALTAAAGLAGTFLIPASPAAAQVLCSAGIQSPHAEQTGLLERLGASDRIDCSGLRSNSVYIVNLETLDFAHEFVDVPEAGWVEEQSFATDANGNLHGVFDPTWNGLLEPGGTWNTMYVTFEVTGAAQLLTFATAQTDYLSS